MHQKPFWLGAFFEAALGFLAILLAFIFEVSLWGGVSGGWIELIVVVFVSFGFFCVFLMLCHLPFAFARTIRYKLSKPLSFLFKGNCLSQILLISVIAGWGEELLFRGFLQLYLTQHFGIYLGLAIPNLLFGFLHWISFPYAIIAGLFGFFLSLAMLYTNDNLLVPILIHAIYDFFAFCYLRHLRFF